MKKIYAPWREQYVRTEARTKNDGTQADECVFCTQCAADDDEKHLILYRGNNSIIIMNYYPYNAGHLMVLPFKHTGQLNNLTQNERGEFFELINTSIEVLKKTLEPGGFNVGMNLGKTAGAGIPSHLHMHIVPRWAGDTNFMPIIGEVKPISFDLTKMYEQLKAAF